MGASVVTLVLTAVAQCVHEQGEGRRGMTAAWVIEVVGGKWRTPICKHADQLPSIRSDQTCVRVISERLRQEVKPYNIRTTIFSPGALATELPDSITEGDVSENISQFYERYATPASSFASMVAFAMSQPEDVDVNEILFRPTAQEL